MESKRLKIGIFGGTFNPPHLGHRNAVLTAYQALNLDKVLLIPALIPPHKELPKNTATTAQRLFMTRLMAKNIENCEVLDIEILRGGKSYTFETVSELSEKYPNARFWLLMGTDMFFSFEKWKRTDIISKFCTLAVMARQNEDKKKMREHAEYLEKKLGTKTDIIDIDVMEISSTMVREKIRNGDFKSVLERDIADFVVKNGIYSDKTAQITQEKALEYVKSRLSNSRMEHTLGVIEFAEMLAEKFGENKNDAKLAATLHDCTKELSFYEQLKLCEKYDIMLKYNEKEIKNLIHADTAAAVAFFELGVSEKIRDAIKYHTTGSPKMDKLAKIIYLSDMFEKGRRFDGVEELRQEAMRDLDGAIIHAMERSLSYIRSSGIIPNQKTEETLSFLKKQKEKI